MPNKITDIEKLIKWMDKNKKHCTYGTIRGKAVELLNESNAHCPECLNPKKCQKDRVCAQTLNQ